MATSGVTTWSLTARDIIIAALQENAIIGLGRSPTSAEADACLLRLNALLQSLPASEHRLTTGTIAIAAEAQATALAPDIDTVLSARLVLNGGTERLMHKWGRDEYFRLPNKAQTGEPITYYEAKGLGGVTLHLWPVPSAGKTLKVDYLRRVETVTNLAQTVDFPQRHQEALYANLAMRCAGLFGVPVGQELALRAQRLEREMSDAERPDSYTFEADCA